MGKLTEAQIRVLRKVTWNNGFFSPLALGVRTCEALRKRGMLEGDYPFEGSPFDYRQIRVTAAGRAALRSADDGE